MVAILPGRVCPDWARVPASVSFRTADDTLAATVSGRILLQPDEQSILRARGDLSQARGSLDLQLDPALTYDGLLQLELFATAEGQRARLTVSANPRRPPQPIGAPPPSSPLPASVLEGHLPDDHCDLYSFAVDATTPLPRFDHCAVLGTLPADCSYFLDECLYRPATGTPPERCTYRGLQNPE